MKIKIELTEREALELLSVADNGYGTEIITKMVMLDAGVKKMKIIFTEQSKKSQWL